MRALSIDSRVRRLGMDIRGIPGLEAAWLSRFPYGLGTMTLPADGTAMGTWVDLSGKGRDLTQGTAGSQPLWRRAGVNLLGAWADGSAASVTEAFNSTIMSVTAPVAGSLSYALKATAKATGGFTLTHANVSVVAGQTYSASASILSGTSLAAGTVIAVRFRNDAGNTVTSPSKTVPPLSTSAWTWAPFPSVLAPVGATKAAIEVFTPTSAVGDVLYATALQLEQSPTATPWLPPGNAQGMQFDGVNDLLQTVPLAGWPETTVYAVASVLGGAGTFRALFNQRYNVNPAVRGLILYTEDSNNFAAWGGNGTGFINAGYPDGTADSVRHVWSARFNPSSINFRIDGGTSVLAGAGFTPVTAVDNRSIYIGAGNDLGNQFFMSGLIHDIIICSVAHDDATRKRVEAGLARANGVTLAP